MTTSTDATDATDDNGFELIDADDEALVAIDGTWMLLHTVGGSSGLACTRGDDYMPVVVVLCPVMAEDDSTVCTADADPDALPNSGGSVITLTNLHSHHALTLSRLTPIVIPGKLVAPPSSRLMQLCNSRLLRKMVKCCVQQVFGALGARKLTVLLYILKHLPMPMDSFYLHHACTWLVLIVWTLVLG
jgi:hypothetical protein